MYCRLLEALQVFSVSRCGSYLCIQKGKAYLYYTCYQPIHSDMRTGLVLHKALHFDSSEHKQL